MTRRGRIVSAVVGAFVILLVVCLTNADMRFYLRGAVDESRILLKRQPLDRLIVDSSISPQRRALFALVRDVRQFARDSLGLNTGRRYATFSDVGRDTLVLVLSASPQDALREYVWHFPLVGDVPYKGFFDFAAAAREAKALEASGYDTYTRPAPAFSTLGFFDDPVLSTMLTNDRVSMAATIFHELTHSTWYVPNQTAFDESFANFAGWRAAECFFQSRGDSASAGRAARIWQAERREGDVFASLSMRLDSVYAHGDDPLALRWGRDSAFAAARAELNLPPRATLNNATVIAQRIYLTRLGAFDSVLASAGGEVVPTFRAIGGLARGDAGRQDPYSVIATLQPGTGGGCTLTIPPLHSSP